MRGGRSSSVLVVDDDALFRELVLTILRRAGYRTQEAATGEEALELAKRQRPDVVVLDVHLPRLSGHEVCARLRRAGERPRVLFVSGERVEPYDRVAGLLVGGDDYLIKPFAPDELLARVRALVKRVQEAAPPELTSDERDLARVLHDGVGTRELARRLGEPETVVQDRLDSLLAKLGA